MRDRRSFAGTLIAAAVCAMAACSMQGTQPDAASAPTGRDDATAGSTERSDAAAGGPSDAANGATMDAMSHADAGAPVGSGGSDGSDGPGEAAADRVGATARDAGAGDAPGASADGATAGGVLPRIPGTVTIMALGDSITRATCWRAQLWQELKAAFPSRFQLVGTLSSDNGCNVAGYDTANQGYSSSLVTEVVAGITNARTCDPFCPTLDDLSTAFDTVKPDVVLMHYGTNDVWNGKAPDDILSAYSAIVDKLRAANPGVVVLVAEIIPMNVTAATCSGCSCASCPTAVPALNARIAAWAPTKSTPASPVVAVDQYTGFDAVADTRDGVHPNNTTGSQKMADRWFAALTPLF